MKDENIARMLVMSQSLTEALVPRRASWGPAYILRLDTHHQLTSKPFLMYTGLFEGSEPKVNRMTQIKKKKELFSFGATANE